MAEPQFGEWYPIETAPKEPLNAYKRGPSILGCNGSYVFVFHWQANARPPGWRTGYGYPPPPTHWMPLPEPLEADDG